MNISLLNSVSAGCYLLSWMLAGCMQLIDTLPETVYRVCDLIGVITNRNGAKWRDQALTTLVAEVSSMNTK